MSVDRMLIRRIVTALDSHAYRFAQETQLHEALATVLDSIGLNYKREHVASPKDRFDFLCEGGIVIEAKVKGTMPAALRQIDRYCGLDEVSAVILVATRQWATRGFKAGAQLRGKPIFMVKVSTQAF